MATRNSEPSRTVWAPTRPADTGPATRPLPAALAKPQVTGRPADGWLPSLGAKQATAPAAGAFAGAIAKPITRPAATAFGAFTAPLPVGALTAPLPLGGVKPPARPAGTPVGGVVGGAVGGAVSGAISGAGRPLASTSPGARASLAGAPTTAARPVQRAVITPPAASAHWQLDGKHGQHLVLMPGQMYLGHQAASVRTLLGSCVAITLWHATRRIGGMCHFLLPQRKRRPEDALDGRYGDEALEAMVATLKKLGTQPGEYVAHLYGGADTMSGTSGVRFNIGERNIEAGWSLIDRYGFSLDGVDVGEDIPRTVSQQLDTGEVTMRRGTGQAPDHLRD